MYEREHRYAAVEKNIRMDGADTVTLKGHKHRYVGLAKSIRTDGASGYYDVYHRCIVL